MSDPVNPNPPGLLSYVSMGRQVHLVMAEPSGLLRMKTLCRVMIQPQIPTSPVAEKDMLDLHTDLLCRNCAAAFHFDGYRESAQQTIEFKPTTIHADRPSIHRFKGEKQLDLF